MTESDDYDLDTAGEYYLTEVELHRLESGLAKTQQHESALANIKLRVSALDAKLELSQTQLKLIELQVEKQKKALQAEHDSLVTEFEEAKATYEEFRDNLGKEYNLDMRVVSYDPISGRLHVGPDEDEEIPPPSTFFGDQ